MRRLLPLALVLTIAVLLGPACGDSGRKALAVLVAAQTKTIAADSSRVAVVIDTPPVQTGAKALKLSGEGAFDFATRKGTLEMDASALGLPGVTGTVQLVMLGDVVYLLVPPGLLPGKPWLKVDLNGLGQGAVLGIGGVQELASSDPGASLRFLGGLRDDAKKVGKEKVRGVDTTHFRVTVDLEKAKTKASAEVKDAIDRVIKQIGRSNYPADVWVDGDDLIRRLRFNYGGVSGGGTGGAAVATQEFFDFGAKVDATAPPADQVSDFTKLLQSAGRGG